MATLPPAAASPPLPRARPRPYNLALCFKVGNDKTSECNDGDRTQVRSGSNLVQICVPDAPNMRPVSPNMRPRRPRCSKYASPTSRCSKYSSLAIWKGHIIAKKMWQAALMKMPCTTARTYKKNYIALHTCIRMRVKISPIAGCLLTQRIDIYQVNAFKAL